MSQTSTVLVEDVTEKSGTSQKTGKPWTKWALKDGNGDWYDTFERGVVTPDLKGTKVVIEWEPDGNFKNLLRVAPHEDSPIGSRTDTGEADWDLIGLRKTRCALWAAYIPDALALAFSQWRAAQSIEPGTVEIVSFMSRIGRELITAAEVDIFHRAPAQKDEDVPF